MADDLSQYQRPSQDAPEDELAQFRRPGAEASPDATISAVKPGAMNWLENFQGDIRHGTGITGPGRFLQHLGFTGIDTGVPESVGETPFTGGLLIGPAQIAHGAGNLFGDSTANERVRGFNELTKGAINTFGAPAAAAAPALLPQVVPSAAVYGTIGTGASKAASELGADPDQAEAVGNAAMIGTPLVKESLGPIGRTTEKYGPSIAKPAAAGAAVYKAITTKNPDWLLAGLPGLIDQTGKVVSAVGKGAQAIGDAPLLPHEIMADEPMIQPVPNRVRTTAYETVEPNRELPEDASETSPPRAPGRSMPQVTPKQLPISGEPNPIEGTHIIPPPGPPGLPEPSFIPAKESSLIENLGPTQRKYLAGPNTGTPNSEMKFGAEFNPQTGQWEEEPKSNLIEPVKVTSSTREQDTRPALTQEDYDNARLHGDPLGIIPRDFNESPESEELNELERMGKLIEPLTKESSSSYNNDMPKDIGPEKNFYHGTKVSNLPQIMKEGLKPGPERAIFASPLEDTALSYAASGPESLIGKISGEHEFGSEEWEQALKELEDQPGLVLKINPGNNKFSLHKDEAEIQGNIRPEDIDWGSSYVMEGREKIPLSEYLKEHPEIENLTKDMSVGSGSKNLTLYHGGPADRLNEVLKNGFAPEEEGGPFFTPDKQEATEYALHRQPLRDYEPDEEITHRPGVVYSISVPEGVLSKDLINGEEAFPGRGYLVGGGKTVSPKYITSHDLVNPTILPNDSSEDFEELTPEEKQRLEQMLDEIQGNSQMTSSIKLPKSNPTHSFDELSEEDQQQGLMSSAEDFLMDEKGIDSDEVPNEPEELFKYAQEQGWVPDKDDAVRALNEDMALDYRAETGNTEVEPEDAIEFPTEDIEKIAHATSEDEDRQKDISELNRMSNLIEPVKPPKTPNSGKSSKTGKNSKK